MAARSKACHFCADKAASHFCNCENPPSLFCLACCGLHNAKAPRSIHHTIPIAALNQNPIKYERKNKALEKRAAALRRNVQLLEQFCQEFDTMVQSCINFLTEYRTWWLHELQTEKEELQVTIETAVKETTDCLDQGLKPVGLLAQAIWTLPPAKLQVINYSITPPDLQGLSKTWVSYQNSLYCLSQRFSNMQYQIPRDRFAAVYGNIVELYDLKFQQSVQRTLPVNFGWGGSCTVLDRNTLLCLGAWPPSTAAHQLDLPSLQLTSVPPFGISRAYIGVAKVVRFVYIFGGCDRTVLNTCEKYELQHRQWLALGNMREGRFAFTPCTFRALIYLPCPSSTRTIETFSPETEVFSLLTVSLPIKPSDNFSVAFVANEELCILTGKRQLGRWKVGSEEEFRFSATDVECCSNQQPLIVNSTVLIANNYPGREGVEKFSLESYTFFR